MLHRSFVDSSLLVQIGAELQYSDVCFKSFKQWLLQCVQVKNFDSFLTKLRNTPDHGLKTGVRLEHNLI